MRESEERTKSDVDERAIMKKKAESPTEEALETLQRLAQNVAEELINLRVKLNPVSILLETDDGSEPIDMPYRSAVANKIAAVNQQLGAIRNSLIEAQNNLEI